MGKEVRGHSETAPLSPDPERSIGAYLARQRELRGISLDELAALTRIPRRSIERLESGVFDRAPDGFVRGFVRTVADALGLDPENAVMRLLREPSDDDERVANERALRRSRGIRIAVAAGVALIALVGLVRLVATGDSRPGAPVEKAPDENAPETVMRRDPIRALALEAERRPRPAPVAAPEPAAPADPAALAGAAPEEPVVAAATEAAAPAAAAAPEQPAAAVEPEAVAPVAAVGPGEPTTAVEPEAAAEPVAPEAPRP